MKTPIAILLLLAGAPLACVAPEKASSMSPANTTPFDCAGAPALLGHPTAQVKSCDQLLPDLWRVVLIEGDFAPGHHEVIPLVWEQGRIVQERGDAALGHYLARIRVEELENPNDFGFQVLLEVLAAAPPGFHPGDLFAESPSTGDRGGVSMKPFALTLLRPHYTPPPAAVPGGPPMPPSVPGPTEGPAAAPSPPPAAAPPGGPPGPPPGAGPSGAVSQPRLGRATLRGDSSQGFTWTIEVRETPAASWTQVATRPVPAR